jgi:hypothetical protein
MVCQCLSISFQPSSLAEWLSLYRLIDYWWHQEVDREKGRVGLSDNFVFYRLYQLLAKAVVMELGWQCEQVDVV